MGFNGAVLHCIANQSWTASQVDEWQAWGEGGRWPVTRAENDGHSRGTSGEGYASPGTSGDMPWHQE